MTTRVTTEEGMLRSAAVLTRSGNISYLASELGMAGDGTVTVNRTMETLGHPDTLASLRGAPITLGHPPGGVTPDNFKDVVVGAVAGEPRVAGDAIVGDVFIGDGDALKRLDDGVEELSIGYDFVLGPNGDTMGPLRINHVALVERGRAGSGVRVLDSLGDEDMTKQEITDAVNAALDMGMKHRKMDGESQADIAAAVKDALSPVIDGMKKMTDAADAAQAAADRKKAEDDAKAAAAKLVKDTEDRMRSNFVVYTDALPLIPEDQREGLAGKDAKTVLVAALKDVVPNAETQSVDFLRGALTLAKAKAASDTNPNGGLPPGVQPFQQAADSGDTRTKAIDSFVDAQMKRYTESGGR